jgi:hypothetical protein
MSWMTFLLELFGQLAKCMEERRRDVVEKELLTPGFASRRVAARLLRQQGFHGRELREEVDEAMEYLKEQDAEDISLLLFQAEAHANALVRREH